MPALAELPEPQARAPCSPRCGNPWCEDCAPPQVTLDLRQLDAMVNKTKALFVQYCLLAESG
jgi:hypothetical protein